MYSSTDRKARKLCRSLHQAGAGVIKAFALREPDDLKQTALYAPYCDWFLFDTPSDAYGGSGKRFDWKLLDSYEGPLPFLLSGGLSPESIESLSRFRNPWWQGIDLNSGFELHPGEKDIPRLKTFINLFKTLDYEPYQSIIQQQSPQSPVYLLLCRQSLPGRYSRSHPYSGTERCPDGRNRNPVQ